MGEEKEIREKKKKTKECWGGGEKGTPAMKTPISAVISAVVDSRQILIG